MPPERRSLLQLTLAPGTAGRTLSDDAHRVALDDLRGGISLEGPLSALRGRSVLIACEGQLTFTLAALALDGVARRIFLCLPDLADEHLPGVMADGEVDAVVTDGTGPQPKPSPGLVTMRCASRILPGSDGNAAVDRSVETEWVMFTSGTTGRPKMVVHTLASLAGPLEDGVAVAPGTVWSTFYDVRRYGGQQVLFRCLLGGGSMVMSSVGESVGDFLARAGAAGITHISGTPSHWRRALMSGVFNRIAPRYVRVSGEVADQAILDNLRQAYGVEVAHAFASTEAGLAFDVRDGFAGFPVAYVGAPNAKAEMKIQDGTLRVRSTRMASRYLGARPQLGDSEHFIDTGDMIEQRGDRYYFVGRREGVINVGGQKVFPEEVEAVINRHPAVHMSRVWARKNPITGAVVAADIVMRGEAGGQAGFVAARDSILQACRDGLPAHKVPVSLRAVPALSMAASGKLMRRTDA